jgi:sporulation integral membrane protein YlbJ
MFVLIIDPQTALAGGLGGITLCLRSVIPALFPFLVLSGLLVDLLTGHSNKLLRCIGKITGVPYGAESLLIVGFLGGYPAGAQAISRLYSQRKIDVTTARHLLTFCSNAGPAFLFGIVAGKFRSIGTVWLLWVVHILSALIVGFITAPKESLQAMFEPCGRASPSHCVKNAVHATAMICGWVILFRVMLEFGNKLVLLRLPETLRICISGILELTNGCCQLENIMDADIRFIVASGMLSFGGLCVVMQTSSFTQSIGLRSYLTGKIMHFAISTLISILLVRPGITPATILALCVIILREVKKRCSFPQPIVV